MINKENNDKQQDSNIELKPKEGYIDIANMDVQCHLLIKDKDTGEILVNKRG